MAYNAETILPAIMGQPCLDFGNSLPTQKQIIQFWMLLVIKKRAPASCDNKKSPTKIDISSGILETIASKVASQWRSHSSKSVISDSKIEDRVRRLLQKALAIKQFGTRSNMNKYISDEQKKFQKLFDIEDKSNGNKNVIKVSLAEYNQYNWIGHCDN